MTSLRSLDWISLSKTDTTFVFATTHSITGSPWPWIEECVRHEFECFDDDDVNLIETDDGRELVTVNGSPVVEIHNCRLNGYAAGAEPARIVA
jgi:hypothetical protein